MSHNDYENIVEIRDTLSAKGWFQDPGLYVLVDGQFGSTGKGLMAAVLAAAFADKMDVITSNAGPNSGHTAYLHDDPDQKVMTQQLPVASVFATHYGFSPVTYLNGGAVIDADILRDEVERYKVEDVYVHPHAAFITQRAKETTLSHIASTAKGVGPAMADKLLRDNQFVVAGNADQFDHPNIVLDVPKLRNRVFVETAQGFSLGINTGFYPYTTSRECTVAQAVADYRAAPSDVRKSIVCLRTYPIRVGNTPDGYSGGWYADQRETTWDDIGVPLELTTVTKRVRRVANFSRLQYLECLRINKPDVLFLNFCNYMNEKELHKLLSLMFNDYLDELGHEPDAILLGYGPMAKDVRLLKTSVLR